MARLAGAAAGAWRCRCLRGARACRSRDDRGVTVDVARSRRSASSSLLPSLTETVCALGACDRLVGVDDYSNWPGSVRALPHVGGLEDAQHRSHRRAQARPGAARRPRRARCERLRGAGPARWWRWSRKTLADVQRVLAQLGPGARRAATPARSWRGIEPAWRRRRARCRRGCAAPRVYFEVSSGPLRGQRVLVHRRDADAAGRAQHRAGRARARFPSSTRSSWCAPTRS